MPYRVRSVILGVLSLLLFGPASSAAQSGPPAAEASVVYTGEMVGGAVGGLDQDVVYLDNVDVTATLRADSSSAGRGQRAPHRSGHVARGSPAGTGGPAWGRAGGGAGWRAGRPGGSGGTPRINAERSSSSSVDNLDVPPNRWEKKAAAKRAPSGWQGRSVTRTTTS